jgi:HAAS
VVDVNPSGDPIEDYLDRLQAGLRTTPRETRRIIAEAEDHLRDGVADGQAAGLSEREAQEAAISSFGSVSAVVRAHQRRFPPAVVVGELVMAAWKLAGILLLAVAGSGVVALIMNVLLGRRFVGGSPSAATLSAARCHYWLSIWPSAHTCTQAAMLEASSDAVSLRVAAAVPGLLVMAAYVLVRHYRRRRGQERQVLPDGFVPTVAASLFAAMAAGLAGLSVTQAHAVTLGGPGQYLSGAIAALAVAVAFVPALRRTLLRHAPG